MKPQTLALISTVTNLVLAILKFIIGSLTGSIALIAEAIHSTLDIISSGITFLGIKISKKPADKKHPYGHQRYESIASFLIVILLFLSATWIFYEAGRDFILHQTGARFSFGGVLLMGFSVIINEIMARLKYRIGNRYSSLALIADAEHTRADVLSSGAVLLGLILIRYYPFFDSILALGVALYILKETFSLGKETIDSLVDTANPELEEKIKKTLQKNKFQYSQIRTRKIGATNFAEITLTCNPQAKMSEVSALTKSLEQELLSKIPELSQVSILVESHNVSENIVRPRFWGRFRFRRGFQEIGPEKKGKRIIIPLEEGEIAPEFGAPEYLLIDISPEGKVIQKNKLKNPYFENQGNAHGIKFIKSVKADKLITPKIGENALENLKSLGVEAEIIPKTTKLKDLGYA